MKKQDLNHLIQKSLKENFPGFKNLNKEADKEDEIDIEDIEDKSSEDNEDENTEFEASSEDFNDDSGFDGGGGMGPEAQEVQDHLQQALEAARELGDEKLSDQIGNTITFFTRTHIVKEGDDEEMNYVHDNIDEVATQCAPILQELMIIGDEMEQSGPIDEDLADAIESLDKVVEKKGTKSNDAYNDALDENKKEPLDESLKHFKKYAGLNK